MVTRSAPSRLTAQKRARRAARGGASRSVPAPLLAPALIAVAFLLLPLAGLLIRAPWGHMAAALSGPPGSLLGCQARRRAAGDHGGSGIRSGLLESRGGEHALPRR